MNERIEIKIEELASYKSIMCDTENTTNEDRNKIISDAIIGSLTFSSTVFSQVVEELILLQNKKTSIDVIYKLDDIKLQENFDSFITFSEDEKDYFIIGDLHADLNSFLQILKAINFQENFDNINLIFLGDYVDRGKDKLELINRVILLKYLLPNNIHLLRGNHELYRVDDNDNYVSPMMNADESYLFNFLTLLVTNEKYKDYGVTKEFIKLYADFFDSMPTVALFNFSDIKICAMHGGLPRVDLNSIDYYGSENYESFNRLLSPNTKDSVGIRQKINILWSDPYEGHEEAYSDSSDVRFSFSQNQFIAFCKKYNIDMIIRAHEQQNNGYKSYFNNRLISVFSSGGKNLNEHDIVNERSYYSNVSPNIIKLSKTHVESININFTTDYINSIEESFEYMDIKKEKENQEQEYKTYQPTSFTNLFEDLQQTDGVVKIVDMYNNSNQKLILLKNELISLNHSTLEQFYGIDKDLKFSFNISTKVFTNLCEKTLKIGANGATLYKEDTVQVSNKFVVSSDNAFSLVIVF